VVDRANANKLIGRVHRHDVINAQNEEIMRRDLAGSLSSTISLVGKMRQVDIGDGHVIQEISAPYPFCDRTLKDLAVGSHYGVHVIFLRTGQANDESARITVPHADTHIREGDTLIVAGTKAAVDAVAAL